MFPLLGGLGVTPASVLECSKLPKVVGSGSSWQLWERNGSLDAEWEDESLFCSFWTQTGAGRSFWLCTAADRRRNPALDLQMSYEHRGADGAPGA